MNQTKLLSNSKYILMVLFQAEILFSFRGLNKTKDYFNN